MPESEGGLLESPPPRPQGNAFDTLITLKKVATVLLWIIFALSIAKPLIGFLPVVSTLTYKVTYTWTFIVIVVTFAIISYLVDYYFFPTAEQIRREDFIDNSFGSKYNLEPSEQYYSNDLISIGVYKASINLFESCFFTCQISQNMWLNRLVVPIIFSSVIIGLAIVGFAENQIAIPTVQFFLSAQVVGDLIKFSFFRWRNQRCFRDIQALFCVDAFKRHPTRYLHQFLKVYGDYETNLAWGMILLDERVYRKENAILSDEWEKIKIKYSV